MLHTFQRDTSLHHTLLLMDQQCAEAVKQQDCRYCGGRLHQAHYPRLGFGVPASVAPLYAQRLSFCCGSCRRRTTAPSLRFFGRRRYISVVLVLLSALRFNPCEQRCETLARRFGLNISASTWKRWRAWWRQRFPHTRFWNAAKALVPITLPSTALPRALLKAFDGLDLSQRLIRLLQFLSPVTGEAI